MADEMAPWMRALWVIVVVLVVVTGALMGVSLRAAAPPPPRNLDRASPSAGPQIIRQEVLSNGRLATSVRIPAAADTYIASGYPNQNFGNDPLFLGYNATGDIFGAERILMQFDVLSAIPPGALVTDAYVQLHLNYASPADDAPLGTNLRAIASAWDEHSVTWNTQPARGGIRTTVFVGTALTSYEWPITDLVSDWVDGDLTNNGLEIYGDEEPEQRERTFYAREAGSGETPHLIVDFTADADAQPPEISVDALPTYSPRNFDVSWDGSDPGGAGIAHYDVDFRVDGGAWVSWLRTTTDTSAAFTGQNGIFYEFRARGVDRVGNVEPFGGAEAATTVDTAPPSAVVQPLPALIRGNSFTVSWSAAPSVSGIDYYDVRYRFNNGSWSPWQVQTLATSALFTAAEDGVYAFEARAVDNAGLIEMFVMQAEATIAVDAEMPFVTPSVWLPNIARSADTVTATR